MTKLTLLAAALLAVAGCKSETARKADRAAENVLDQRADLREAQKDVDVERKQLTEERVDVIEESKDVAKEAAEVANAESTFAASRELRVQVFRATHAVVATQPMLISTMSTNFDLTDAGRAEINTKLTVFQLRLDEAANLIQGLQNVDAAQWRERHEAVGEAMKKLEGAREDAWKALDDAPRVDPSAS